MITTPTKLPRMESDEDCISDLPGDIICRILSCLSMVDAVRTSVLSKQWEYKWTSIYNINITDEKRKWLRRKECGVAFVNFMRRITSRTTNVRKVRLCLLMKYKVAETKSWMLALLRNKIEILHLETPHRSSTRLVIPASHLNTISLRDMVLSGPKFKVPTTNCFTNLRNSRLDRVCICNENSGSDTLVLNFPILETFELSMCNWFAVKLVEVYAPALITFSSDNHNFNGPYNHTINIHGDSLAEFTSTGSEPEDIFVTGSKVVRAKFRNILYKYEPMRGGLQIQRLLKEFACTLDHLTISFDMAEAMLKPKQGASLTSFTKLRQLALYNVGSLLPRTGIVAGNTSVLLELLHSMPCLKCLKLSLMYWYDFDYEAIESTPSCITSSLEKIEFVDIINYSAPLLCLGIAKFILKSALSLKEFHVYDYNYGFNVSKKKFADYFVEKISAYPTGSACVTFATGSS